MFIRILQDENKQWVFEHGLGRPQVKDASHPHNKYEITLTKEEMKNRKESWR